MGFTKDNPLKNTKEEDSYNEEQRYLLLCRPEKCLKSSS